jgi:hypothetical protein
VLCLDFIDLVGDNLYELNLLVLESALVLLWMSAGYAEDMVTSAGVFNMRLALAVFTTFRHLSEFNTLRSDFLFLIQ